MQLFILRRFFTVAARSKSAWDFDTVRHGNMLSLYTFSLLPMRWICSEWIRWLWWSAVWVQLAFIPNRNSTNVCDFHVEYTNATHYAWFCQYNLLTRSFPKGELFSGYLEWGRINLWMFFSIFLLLDCSGGILLFYDDASTWWLNFFIDWNTLNFSNHSSNILL